MALSFGDSAARLIAGALADGVASLEVADALVESASPGQVPAEVVVREPLPDTVGFVKAGIEHFCEVSHCSSPVLHREELVEAQGGLVVADTVLASTDSPSLTVTFTV